MDLINGRYLKTKDDIIFEYQRIKIHIADDIRCKNNIDWYIENGTMENVEYWIERLNKSKMAKINKLNFYYKENGAPRILGQYKGEEE